MLRLSRMQVKVVPLALIVFVIGLVGPGIAASGPVAADQVDRRHAVGPAASAVQRAGKLVATNSSGRLPGSLFSKLAASDQLDGMDSDQFARTERRTDSSFVLQYMNTEGDPQWLSVLPDGFVLETTQQVEVIKRGPGAYCVFAGSIGGDAAVAAFRGLPGPFESSIRVSTDSDRCTEFLLAESRSVLVETWAVVE